jgi:hypothetical protein
VPASASSFTREQHPSSHEPHYLSKHKSPHCFLSTVLCDPQVLTRAIPTTVYATVTQRAMRKPSHVFHRSTSHKTVLTSRTSLLVAKPPIPMPQFPLPTSYSVSPINARTGDRHPPTFPSHMVVSSRAGMIHAHTHTQ